MLITINRESISKVIDKFTVGHLAIFGLSLAITSGWYRALRRGYEYMANHLPILKAFPFLRDHFISMPLSLQEKSILSSIGYVALLIFGCVYTLFRISEQSQVSEWPKKVWLNVLAVSFVGISLVCISFRVPGYIPWLAVVGVFFLLLLVIVKRIIKIWIKFTTILAEKYEKSHDNCAVLTVTVSCIAIAIVVYLTTPKQDSLTFSQWLMLFGAAFTVGLAYWRMNHPVQAGQRLALVIVAYVALAFALFASSLPSIFRSDYWLISALFNSVDHVSMAGLKRIALFEMFGDIRFQPLAHWIMYARHLVFGNDVLLFNILNVLLHAAVGLFIFFILSQILGEKRYAFIFGLLFISLASQFDAVIWTYHIYILLGTLLTLASVALAMRYVQQRRLALLVWSFVMATVCVLLYEASMLVPALIPVVVYGFCIFRGEKFHRQEVIASLVGVLLSYGIYASVTAYGLTLIGLDGRTMSLHDILGSKNIHAAIKGALVNYKENGIIKNLGVISEIRIADIAYVELPKKYFKEWVEIPKILFGGILLLNFRITRRSWLLIGAIAAIGASYISIITLGRLITNDLSYVVTQPRYQYLPNAFLMLGAGLIFWERYKRSLATRHLITLILLLVTVWNVQNTLRAVAVVTTAMQPMNSHYERIREFLKTHDSENLFIDFIPDTGGKLALGSDIALDEMFGKRITKHINNVSYLYDGEQIRHNQRTIMKEAALLNDFTISWMYIDSHERPPKNIVEVIGRSDTYPRIIMSPDGFIEAYFIGPSSDIMPIRMLRRAKDESLVPEIGSWLHFIVEKNGDTLCLFQDSVLINKRKVTSGIKGWNADGRDLLGGYFQGSREVVFIAKTFMQLDKAKYECASMAIGSRVRLQVPKPW